MLACQNNEGYQCPRPSSINRKATAPEVKYKTQHQHSKIKLQASKKFKTKKSFTCRVLKIMTSGFEKIKFT